MNGITPLLYCIFKGSQENAIQIIERGKDDLDAADNHGQTALHMASYKNNVDIARRLLDAGADVTKVDLNGSTPVHSAARVGAVGVINLFAEKGIRVDARDAHGLTALEVAEQHGPPRGKADIVGTLRSLTESAPPESANGDNKASPAPEMAGTTGDVPVQAGGQQPDHPRSPAVPPSGSEVHPSETTVYPAAPAVYPRGAAGHRPEPAAYPPPTAVRPGPGVYGPETTARLPAPSLYPLGTIAHPSVQMPSPGAYPERPDPRGVYPHPDHSISPSRVPAPEGDVPRLMRMMERQQVTIDTLMRVVDNQANSMNALISSMQKLELAASGLNGTKGVSAGSIEVTGDGEKKSPLLGGDPAESSESNEPREPRDGEACG